MSAWPTVALGDVFEIARGGSPRPIDDFITDDPAGINWIMISDATEGSKCITNTKKRIRPEGTQRSRQVKPGDFLLTNSMSFGKPYILRTEGCIHDGWLVLSPRSGNVDADFFYHLLGSKAIYAEFERRASGATVKNLNIDLVRGVRIPLPPVGEQRRVAAILDKADELRAKRRAAIAQLDVLTQSIFLDMFGDPVKNDRGWPTTTVGHFVAGFETGKNLVADDEDDNSDGLRVLKVSAVTSLSFRPEESKALPPGYVPPPSHFVRRGDLLFSRANTQELIGATALVEHAWEGLVLPDKLWRFIWHDEPRADPQFVHWLFRQPRLRFELGRRATGTSGSMKNISQEKVLDIKMGLPKLPMQREFGRIAYTINRLRQIGEEALSTTNTMFTSLQHRAFRGEL